MLPVDIIPLRKEDTDLYKLQSVVDKTVRSFVPKMLEATEKKPMLSFMIEDILGDSQNKKTNLALQDRPTSPCSQCLSVPTEKDTVLCTVPNLIHDSHSYAFSQGPSRFLPSTTSVFMPLLSPTSVPTRFGYYSPAIASSPPFAFSSRSPDAFTFLPSDFSEHIHGSYFNARQDNIIRSPLYSPSVILDLSNYVPKSSSSRMPPQQVVPLPSTNVECPNGRQIIWKHINRNPAKRKGGQIRFTSEQTTTLEGTFGEHKYLSSTERKRLATALRLSERQVKTWFQNRRAKWRRIKQDPTGLESGSDSEECNPVDETSRPPTCQISTTDDTHLSSFK